MDKDKVIPLPEEIYRLTAKGFLSFAGKKYNYDMLREFVYEQAKKDFPDEDGIPCLIFVKGGVCLFVNQLKGEE